MKITLTRLLDTAAYLKTEAGQQLQDFMDYMAEFVEQTVRSLRGGLTFADNFNCQPQRVTVSNDVAQNVQVAAGKIATGAFVTRVYSTSNKLDSFAWYYDDSNRLTVRAAFSPAPTSTLDMDVLFLF